MNVLKFGGTSVGTAERIKHVAGLTVPRGRNLLVLSAMAGTTNALVAVCDEADAGHTDAAAAMASAMRDSYHGVAAALVGGQALTEALAGVDLAFDTIARALDSEPDTTSRRSLITAQGELMSTRLMTAYMRGQGVNAVLIDALDVMRLHRDGEPDTATLARKLGERIAAAPDADIFITQGFICRDSEGRVATLSRGGSDFTATLMGAAIDADAVEIWTDIDGMHDNDPRVVEHTRRVDRLSYDEASALACYGAKILHPQCVLPARDRQIPVRLLNTLDPGAPGTTIGACSGSAAPKAVAARAGVALVRVPRPTGMGMWQFMGCVARACEQSAAVVDLSINEALGVTMAVDAAASGVDVLCAALEAQGVPASEMTGDMCVVCVAGEGAGTRVLARVASTLEPFGPAMTAAAASGAGVCAVLPAASMTEALRSLSAALFN